jgi:hypothetical protein
MENTPLLVKSPSEMVLALQTLGKEVKHKCLEEHLQVND